MKKLAVFDIDNTVISVDSLIGFVKAVIKYRRPLSWILFLPLCFTALLKACHIISIETMKNCWLVLLRGMSEADLEEFCRQYITDMIFRTVKPGVTEEIMRLRDDGYTIVLATASFECYAQYIAQLLGADIFVGTRLTFDGKRYRVLGKNCKCGEKIVRILEHINKEEIDIANSLSFSDSRSDLPFLDITGTFHLVDKYKWKTLQEIHHER